jgi:hypothetical protein
LKTEFKPALQVLSRKPNAKAILSGQGVSGLALDGDDDDQASKKPDLSPEELRLKAQREREEKQRKYDAARERLFGSPSSSAAVDSPASQGNTPPSGSSDSKPSRGKGRTRGGRDNHSSPNRQVNRSGKVPKEVMKRTPPGGRQLYDPDETSGRSSPRQGNTLDRVCESQLEVPARQPRGPIEHSKGFQTAVE